MKNLLAISFIFMSCCLFACGNKALKYYNLGVVYGNQGKFDEKVEAYQKAISIDPNYAY